MIAVLRDHFHTAGTVAAQRSSTGRAPLPLHGSAAEYVGSATLEGPYRRLSLALLLSGAVLALNVLLVVTGHPAN